MNVQYFDGEKICVRTAAMVEMNSRLTGEHLKSTVLNALATVGVSNRQIYSVTTDGGSNMVKCIDLLIDKQEREMQDPYGLYESIDNVISGITNEENFLSVFESIDIFSDEDAVIIRGVRCAAHSLQLGVEDALAVSDNLVANILNRVRDLAKYLRTTNNVYLLKAHKMNKPVLDNDTRWHSKCDMLESILKLKSICTSMETADNKLHLSKMEWESIAVCTCRSCIGCICYAG